MAITLAEAQLMSQDKLVNYVIDEIRKSVLLDMLTFDNTANASGGNTLNYVYSKVNARPTSAFRAINSDYTAGKATTKRVSVSLAILGGSYEMDRVIQNYATPEVYSSQEAYQVDELIKAIRRGFESSFISGDSTKTTNSFDGLDKLMSSDMIIDNGIDLSTAAKITSNYTDLTDAFRDMEAELIEAPSVWLCSREGYALIQKIADRATGFTTTKDEFGRQTFYYNGSRFVPIGDTVKSGYPAITTDSTTGKTAFYPVVLGLEGVHGIAPVGNSAGITTYLIDNKSSDAVRKGACEMVTAIALKNSRAAGKVLAQIKTVASGGGTT